MTEISEIQQKVVKDEGFTETEVSQHRVFLLGENRWEEPSRLAGRDKQVMESKNKDTRKRCHVDEAIIYSYHVPIFFISYHV